MELKIKVHVNWKNFDKSGRLISETEHEANSLVKAFINHLVYGFNTLVNQQTADTSGTNRTLNSLSSGFSVMATATTSTYGILLGTSNQAVSLNDNALITPIIHGIVAGTLQYGATTMDAAPTTDGSSRYIQIYRTFTNSSGGNITVNEVGLVIQSQSSNYKFLFDRSLSTNTINNGNAATLTYKITLTV